jgi:ABC-2 type transport system permease protein
VLGLYWRLVWARERGAMQYKLSFALMSLSTMAFWTFEFLAIVTFFQHIPTLGGWTLPEVAFLYGLGSCAFSVAELFATGFDELPRHIRQGTFDRVLVRPLGAFFQTFSAGLGFRRFGRVGQCAVITLVAIALLDRDWRPDKVAVLVLALASGVAIYFSIFVAGAAYSFWTVQGTEVVNVFTNGGQFVTSYPLDAYAGWLRRTLTFVFPLAFVGYYPALYVLDRPAPLGLPDWTRLLSPLIAALFVLLAARAWSAGVRRYVSTGS